MNSVALWLFTLTHSFYFDAFLRFCIGFFQVFVCIYMPVWADAFASEKQKSAWLTFLLLASPVGVVIGFTLTSFMNHYANWRYSFYVQAFCLVPCVLAFMFTKRKYLDIEEAVKYKHKCQHIVQKKLYRSITSQKIEDRATSNASKSPLINTDFQEFLDSLNSDLFKNQNQIPQTQQNIMKIREKTLEKIEKQI